MNRDGKLYALLATARIANVPSVVSNLGVGVLLGSLDAGEKFSWPWTLMMAAVLADELVRHETELTVSPAGAMLLRVIAMAFDAWLSGDKQADAAPARFSRTARSA